LGRAIDELRKTKATKDALSEAASELRQNIEQETQSRTKRQDALTGQLEKLNSDVGGFQTTTDGKLQEQNDRIAALEQQLVIQEKSHLGLLLLRDELAGVFYGMDNPEQSGNENY